MEPKVTHLLSHGCLLHLLALPISMYDSRRQWIHHHLLELIAIISVGYQIEELLFLEVVVFTAVERHVLFTVVIPG